MLKSCIERKTEKGRHRERGKKRKGEREKTERGGKGGGGGGGGWRRERIGFNVPREREYIIITEYITYW